MGYYMRSYGPRLALAEALLEHGRKESVHRFLLRVKEEWANHGDVVERWLEWVSLGVSPIWE